MDSKAECYKA